MRMARRSIVSPEGLTLPLVGSLQHRVDDRLWIDEGSRFAAGASTKRSQSARSSRAESPMVLPGQSCETNPKCKFGSHSQGEDSDGSSDPITPPWSVGRQVKLEKMADLECLRTRPMEEVRKDERHLCLKWLVLGRLWPGDGTNPMSKFCSQETLRSPTRA